MDEETKKGHDAENEEKALMKCEEIHTARYLEHISQMNKQKHIKKCKQNQFQKEKHLVESRLKSGQWMKIEGVECFCDGYEDHISRSIS